MSSLAELNEHRYSSLARSTLFARPGFDPAEAGSFLLRMPWRAQKTAPGVAISRTLRESALAAASTGRGGERGVLLEVAVAADQWLSSDPCSERFVFLNPTALHFDGKPKAEWDVIRIDLREEHTWALVATECAVKRSDKKDESAREKLEDLRKAVAGRFDDLHSYTTLLATIDDGSLDYEDAGRSYTPMSGD